MQPTRIALGLLALIVLGSVVAACGRGSTAQGGERQRCYPNGTCNSGLTCASDVCVKIDNSTAGTTGAGGAGGAGGSSDGTAGTIGTGGDTTGTAGTTNAAGTTGAAGSAAGAAGATGTGGGVAGTMGVAGTTGAAGRGGTTGTAGTTGSGGTTGGPCPFPFDYGSLASATMPAAAGGNGVAWEYPLPGGVAGDSLKLSLVSASVTFGAGLVHTGTFPISGPELNYATCGVCLRIESPAVNGEADMYMATAGTVTITSLSRRFTGTITGATFQHVRLNGLSQSVPIGDGCTSAISSFSFDVLIF